jgi:anti-anti-sigma factor
MPDELFSLDGARLTVHANLEAEHHERFRRVCEQLLFVKEPEITVDLSSVQYIHSLLIGMLCFLWAEAIDHDKEMTCIVSETVAQLFERTGLAKVFTYSVADQA